MKWIIPKKLTASEKRVVERLHRRSRFFVFLREIRHELFDEGFQTELAAVYAPRGQEPVPPALLAMVTLLQAYTGASDAEAVEAAEMDRRWQLVLGSLDMDARCFGQGSLVRFRTRLVAGELDRRLLDRTVELAKRTGKFGWKKLRVALDSSPLRGAGRVEDGWNLIGHAMEQLVTVLARVSKMQRGTIIKRCGATLLGGASLKANLDIDWDDLAARSITLAMVVDQARELIRWGRTQLPRLMENESVSDAVDVLEMVIEQNTEPDPDTPGGRRMRQGVPPNRLCSIGDTDMRHGRKSSSKGFSGYKRHVATLVDAPLVLAARALPANQPENQAVPILLDEVTLHGQLAELFIDRGYVSHPRIAELFREKTPVRCRPWPGINRHGLFTKSEFSIDLRRRQVTCPAGHSASYTAATRRATFGAALCNPCKLRSQCTASKLGRAVTVHPQESLLKKLTRSVATKPGRKLLRKRVPVEHRLARIQSKQGGRARYKGERMNTFDLRRHAALANLLEVSRAVAA